LSPPMPCSIPITSSTTIPCASPRSGISWTTCKD
jgi:hypothetical protein